MKIIEQTGCTERRDRVSVDIGHHWPGLGEPER